MKIKLIILFIISIYSCSQLKEKEINKTNNIITIDINAESPCIQNKLKISKIISLETKKESIIGRIVKIKYRNNKFFILDRDTHRLLVFDTEGDFVQEIGRRGRGPGEHDELRDFSISNDDLIYLLTYNQIIAYNIEGKFIRTINIKPDKNIHLNPLQFATINGNDFYLWQGTFDWNIEKERMPFLMYKMSSDGELTNDNYFPTVRRIMGSRTQFLPSYDGININPPFGVYSIYQISEKDIFENIRIDFGKNSFPANQLESGFSEIVGQQERELMNSSNYCVGINNFLESKDYYYFTFIHEGIIKQTIYSKKTKNYAIGNFSIFTNITCIKGNSFICAVDPFYFKNISPNIITNAEIYNSLRDLTVDIDANPIILQFEICDF